MRIARIGFTPLKGARHTELGDAELSLQGPVGDRRYCLVDPSARRVLRTVENPAMVRTVARVDGAALTVELPEGHVHGVPEPTGESVEVDYWGRREVVETVGGPWSEAFSAYLGYHVVMARVGRPGGVVYGASVSIVTASSIGLLADRMGRDVDGARFRATFTLDTTAREPHVEDSWVGRELRLGSATVRVRALVPRCAVIDFDPAGGSRDLPVMAELARYRRTGREILFGVDAVVTSAGSVRRGDAAEVVSR